MKQQCDSQNANPRSDSKSRDPMKSGGGGVAKIESESRSSSYGSGVKRSGSETNRNDHDTNHPPESKPNSQNQMSNQNSLMIKNRIQYYLQSFRRARKRDQSKIFKIEKRIIADQLQQI